MTVAPDEEIFAEVTRANSQLDAVDATALLARPYEPPRFLVRHLIPEASIVLLSGDTGAAKTAFALHVAVSVAAGRPVAARFAVPEPRRVLYVNGEMGADTVRRYLDEALAGADVALEPGQLFFEGLDGVANWHFSTASAAQLEELVDRLRPAIVVLDTQRALLIEDENDGVAVLRAFGWLRKRIVNAFGSSIVVSHHLRKLGPASNNSSQRVAGNRAIVTSVDVHLAALAPEGRPMNALYLDKARATVDGVGRGTEWPIDARLEYCGRDVPSRSYFVAGDPQGAEMSARERTAAALLELVESDGPKTTKQLGATGGGKKRALEELKKTGQIVECGRDGKAALWGTPRHKPATLVTASDHEDHEAEKPLQDKASSLVTHENLGDQEREEGRYSAPPGAAVAVHRGHLVTPYIEYDQSDHDADRAETSRPCPFPVGPAGGTCSRCGFATAEHYGAMVRR